MVLRNELISVVVVCYKDEESLQELYTRLSNVLSKVTNNYEIIFVNDGSPDNAEGILRRLAVSDSRLTVMLQSRNFGAQAAFTAGMQQAVGDAVILMDGDLQDPPELIPQFIEKWLHGADVVLATRRNREKSLGWLNQWLYHTFYILFDRLSYVTIPHDTGDFSLIDRKVVNHINSCPERDRFIRGLRAWAGFHQESIEYVRPERYAGKTTNSFFKNICWAEKAIISFSYRPLDWISYFTFFVVICGLLAVVFYSISFLVLTDAPKGFTTIIVLMLLLTSAQLISLSIIAKYIARIFEEVKQRPQFITKEIINDHKK